MKKLILLLIIALSFVGCDKSTTEHEQEPPQAVKCNCGEITSRKRLLLNGGAESTRFWIKNLCSGSTEIFESHQYFNMDRLMEQGETWCHSDENYKW